MSRPIKGEGLALSLVYHAHAHFAVHMYEPRLYSVIPPRQVVPLGYLPEVHYYCNKSAAHVLDYTPSHHGMESH